jgi:hypothetical protein
MAAIRPLQTARAALPPAVARVRVGSRRLGSEWRGRNNACGYPADAVREDADEEEDAALNGGAQLLLEQVDFDL